jgi:hypothetical protein
LKHFTQQYEIREQHYGHQLRTKALEQQLAEVKLKQQQELFAQEEAKSHLYTEQIAQLLKTEQDLRSQLGLYGDKFEQFQDTLTKSNDVFATFKKEMEKVIFAASNHVYLRLFIMRFRACFVLLLWNIQI